jgi:hypothetical protein
VSIARHADGLVIERPGEVSPGILRAQRWMWPLLRLAHRPTLAGLEHLPEGPFLLVANHSAGLGVSEIFSFAALYLRALGTRRPLAGFALTTSFRTPGLRSALRAVGAIPSTYEHAQSTLAAGVPILVFPGGNHETLRPVWQHDRVDFGGRLGFLKIAREAGVPIVPMGIRGGSFTAPMLLRSDVLARALILPHLIGQKRWGISLLGLLGTAAIALTPLPLVAKLALTLLWLGSPLSFVPWIPWTLRYRIGPPIPAAELFPSGEDDLPAALVRVEAEVGALMRGPQ